MLFVVAPGVAETLAVVTLREASLGPTSPYFHNDNGKGSVISGSVSVSLVEGPRFTVTTKSERSSRRKEKSDSFVSKLIQNSNRSKSVTLQKNVYILKFQQHLK